MRDRNQTSDVFARRPPGTRARHVARHEHVRAAVLPDEPDVAIQAIPFPQTRADRSRARDLIAVDHVDHEAIAAVDQRDDSIVGVARCVRQRDSSRVADLAVEVVDELQNMGIGAALTKLVVRRARANEFALLTATTLWDNWPARALMRRVGFHSRPSRGDQIEVELALRPAGA
jgi:RimJ/RimL family protein N-acetyltransferase